MKLVTVEAAPVPVHLGVVPQLMTEEKSEEPAMFGDHVNLVLNEATEAWTASAEEASHRKPPENNNEDQFDTPR